jgi:hypothetical protein
MVHGRPRAAQGAQQTIGKHLVIFGYQNAHGCLLLFGGHLSGRALQTFVDSSV